MINLEFYKDKIMGYGGDQCLGGIYYKLRGEEPECDISCDDCLKDCIEWLLQDKEKIKLSAFELDLLKAHDTAFLDKPFRKAPILMTMKLVYGYFEDVADLETSIRYIIRHCEVAEDEQSGECV